MRLTKVTVRGFRRYKEEQTLELIILTTLIGKNDVGKSTVLEALEIFFNNSLIKIDSSDLNVAELCGGAFEGGCVCNCRSPDSREGFGSSLAYKIPTRSWRG